MAQDHEPSVAPIATMDDDTEWNDFEDFPTPTDVAPTVPFDDPNANSNYDSTGFNGDRSGNSRRIADGSGVNGNRSDSPAVNGRCSGSDDDDYEDDSSSGDGEEEVATEGEGCLSSSLEDLVGSFDRRLSECFGDYDDDSSKMATLVPNLNGGCASSAANISSESAASMWGSTDMLGDCSTWWTLTGNFGSVLPIDWSKCYIRELHTRSLRLSTSSTYPGASLSSGANPPSCSSISRINDTSSEVNHSKLNASDCGHRSTSMAESNEPSNDNESASDHHDPDLDLSEDEELSEAFDVHSIVTGSLPPCRPGDREQTAEEVIRELDAMMDEGDGGTCLLGASESGNSITAMAVGGGNSSYNDEGYSTIQSSMISSSDSDNMHFRHAAAGMTTSTSGAIEKFRLLCERRRSDATGEGAGGGVDAAECLDNLSTLDLNEVLDEVQTRIREGSAELVRVLAERDEAEYMNELRNQFIASAHRVMKKGKSGSGKGGASKGSGGRLGVSSLSVGRAGGGGTQAPVVIPYTPAQPGPDGDINSAPELSNEMLSVQIRLLEAIHDDSPTLPTQLTEYILKAVCPPKA